MTYASAARLYLDAGWQGVLPLPPRRKKHPPTGYTGRDGTDPSPMDVETWIETRGDGNLALRLPAGVIGIDVDDYGDKNGDAALKQVERELGELPLTIRSTSREGASGIRLFRVPEDAAPHGWEDLCSGSVETISRGWRYMLAWPSVHPDTGETYRWIDERTGEVLGTVLSWREAAWLPSAWASRLARPAPPVVEHAPREDIVPGSYIDRALTGLRRDLDALTWEQNAAWDEGTFKVAVRLAELAKSDWNELTPEAARDFLHEYAPLWLNPTRDWPQPWTSKDVEAKWQSGWRSASEVPPPAPKGDEVASDTAASFFASRPSLRRIHDFARARRASPWAVLAIALTRTVTATPPYYVLPPIIGGPASLNLFVGIVARSGGGKGAAEAAAADAVVTDAFPSVGVGSGEGILHQFVHHVAADKKAGTDAYLEQHEDRVLFTASEVDTLGSLSARQASTLLPELRKVYMGEELSFAYVAADKRLKLTRHSYRAGLVVGIQPSRAGVLLDDADGGTPQRFLWMPGYDSTMPEIAPAAPDPLQVPRLPQPLLGSPSGLEELPVCAEAVDTIVAEHVKRNRGEGDALDGHALLTRLKWAAALALLEGRPEVGSDDWRLAGQMMLVSDAVRGQVVEQLREADEARNVRAGEHAGKRELARDRVIEEERAQRVAAALTRRLEREGGEMGRADLRRATAHRDREWFDEAVDRLVAAGVIERSEIDRGDRYILRSKPST